MTAKYSGRGKAVLMATHVAGMIDLVALPVWVGTLVQHYGLDFEHAGLTVTAFLLGVVAASVVCAPRFNRLPRRVTALAGYALAAIAFAGAAMVRDPAMLLALHALAGVGVGAGLSMTHGTIGRSINPHGLFALAGATLGVFAVAFYAIMPPLIASHGGAWLFAMLAALMGVAALACAGFPDAGSGDQKRAAAQDAPLGVPARFAIAGVIGMALNQAMVFSFVERIGVTRSFGADHVNLLLAAIGIVTLFPAPVAALLQHRVLAHRVALCAPVVQAMLALAITASPEFAPYAASSVVYPCVMIFAHTFLFGWIALLDPSGRTLALTPAMLMTGSAIGPALAGFIAQHIGFPGIGVAACVIAAAAVACFAGAARSRTVSTVPRPLQPLSK